MGRPAATQFPMKIVRIIARLNVGGPARHVVWLTNGLSERGFDTTLIAGTVPPGEADMSYFAAEHGVDPIYIAELSRELSPKDLVSLVKIYRELLRVGPAIVHTHTAKAGTVGRIAAFIYKWLTPGTLAGRPRRVRVVHTFHGHVFHSYYGRIKTGIFLIIERSLARFATDRIVVISEQQLDEINGTFRVGRRSQFRVIPLGMDVDTFSIERSTSSRDPFEGMLGSTIVGFAGRLTAIKDVQLLLAAAALSKESDRQVPPFHFVIIGDGELRQDLERRSAIADTSTIVSFLGNRDDIAELLRSIDIFALTSRNEGTPLSMIEAMAAGKAVISTAVGGVVDLLGDTQSEHDGFRVCERGIAVDSRDPQDFLHGLIYLANNEKLREQLSASALHFVSKNYSISRLLNDTGVLYRELMSD